MAAADLLTDEATVRADVVVVAPHPDDEVIGAGGSIAKHVNAGRTVTSVIVVAREPDSVSCALAVDYEEEIRRAAGALGIQEVILLNEPSRGLQASRALRLRLVEILRVAQPALLYIPHANDRDPEHEIVHAVAMDASWMSSSSFLGEVGRGGSPPINTILGYEVWRPMPRVSYAEEISGVIATKLSALGHYESQMRLSAWGEAAAGLAAYRGMMAFGRGLAEAFDVISMRGQPFGF